MKGREAMRWLLALGMVAIGIAHFAVPQPFVDIVPAALPAPSVLVSISGAFEITGGVGLLLPRARRLAAWGLAALYVAVFPANVNMAINEIGDLPTWALWARLPLQPLLIAWALWVRRE